MFILICITLLVYTLLGKPTKKLVDKLQDINWKENWDKLSSYLRKYGEKAGRVALKPVLTFYYVMQSEDLSTLDRCLIYGAIAYIVIPSDLLPRKALGWLGIIDDAAVLAFIYKKVDGKVTAEIQNRVQTTIDNWLGAEYEVV